MSGLLLLLLLLMQLSPPTHPPCRKIRREVVEKERRAFSERGQQAVKKPIERRKLEANLKEFVRQSIRRFHMG